MRDETPALAPEDVREEAGGLLLALDASHGRGAFEAGWRSLWQLVVEAKAARVLSAESEGPWRTFPDSSTGPGWEYLIGGARLL